MQVESKMLQFNIRYMLDSLTGYKWYIIRDNSSNRQQRMKSYTQLKYIILKSVDGNFIKITNESIFFFV